MNGNRGPWILLVILLLLALAALLWLWTELNTCRTDLETCQTDLASTTPGDPVMPPPGPIIIADPTKSSNIFSMDNSPAACIPVSGNFINRWAVGDVNVFRTTLPGPPERVLLLKRMKATFNHAGSNYELIVRKDSSGFTWVIQGDTKYGQGDPPFATKRHWNQELCGTLVGNIKVLEEGAPTEIDAVAPVEIQALVN